MHTHTPNCHWVRQKLPIFRTKTYKTIETRTEGLIPVYLSNLSSQSMQNKLSSNKIA